MIISPNEKNGLQCACGCMTQVFFSDFFLNLAVKNSSIHFVTDFHSKRMCSGLMSLWPAVPSCRVFWPQILFLDLVMPCFVCQTKCMENKITIYSTGSSVCYPTPVYWISIKELFSEPVICKAVLNLVCLLLSSFAMLYPAYKWWTLVSKYSGCVVVKPGDSSHIHRNVLETQQRYLIWCPACACMCTMS
jgi:hypothetical protein